jgi:nucleotide-binding universal stress UspA family protein
MGDNVDPSWTALLRPDAEKIGQRALSRAAKAACPATLHVPDGSAEEVVLRLSPSFDLVVIGTRRAIHGAAHILDHSVTDAVLRECTRPLLIVREWDTAPTSSPNEAIFRRLIVPVDGSSSAQGAIDVASTLASEHEEELLFVHALDPARAAMFGGPYAFDTGGAFKVMHQFGADVLAKAEASARAAGATRVTSKILDGNPVDAILKAITDERGDAVIIGTHGRHGLDRAVYGSVAEDLVRRSPVPIVALHAPAGAPNTPSRN